MKMLKLSEIRLDASTQPRASLDNEAVLRYSRDMREGVPYDPIEVVFDGTDYWCWDGFHRCAAAGLAQLFEIAANVTEGTLEDAQWLSLAANKRHGMPRTNADKRTAVRRAFAHPKGKSLSDNQIARHVGVSQTFVSRMRRESTSNGAKSDMRTGRDGRTINTANIGRKRRRKRRPRSASEYYLARQEGYRGRPTSEVKLVLPNNHVHNCAYELLERFTFEYLQKVFEQVVKLHQSRQEKETTG